MYKKHPQEWTKHIDFLLLDWAALLCALSLVCALREEIWLPLQSFLCRNVIIFMLPVHFMGTLCMDNHRNILKRGYLRELRAVIEITLFDALALAFYLLSAQTALEFSEPSLIIFFFITLAALYAERMLRKKYLTLGKFGNPYFKNHLLIITRSLIAEAAVKKAKENSFGEYEIVGVLLTDNGGAEFDEKALGVPLISVADGLADHIRDKWIDDALFCFQKEGDIPAHLLESCREMGIAVHVSLDFLTEQSNERVAEKFAGGAVITESLKIVSPQQAFVKRAMDIFGALIGLFVTACLTVIVGPAIYLSDPGPIFFSQPRIGKNGRVFKLYKFRSMYQDAETRKQELWDKNTMDGFMFKMDDDPRILGSGPDGKRHGVGWFLRKYSIDEFPQFWNVLRGELSLVGTRPPLVEEWERYKPHHRARMSVRPGITGLWQVSGRNQIKDFDEVVALDMKYIQTWSVSGDIRIILKTFQAVLSGAGAQ